MSTATADSEGNTVGVGVAACLLAPTSAPTPTPTVAFLVEEPPMMGGGVGVPESSLCTSSSARTSTELATLVKNKAMTGVAELFSAACFATTPVTDPRRDRRRKLRGRGGERRGRERGLRSTQVTTVTARPRHPTTAFTLTRPTSLMHTSPTLVHFVFASHTLLPFPSHVTALAPMAMALWLPRHFISHRLPPDCAARAAAGLRGGTRSLAVDTEDVCAREGPWQTYPDW